MAIPVQILEERTNGFSINTKEVFKILDLVSDKRIAIVSINGNKRTGKSFLLNFFLRYLYSKEVENDNWIYSECIEMGNGFEWRGGPERHTVGTWMWSEPFIITDTDGSEVALLLLDTQGNFDEKTTLNECSILFALSAFLSSTMIFNMMKDVSEDKLQFVELFASFAESFSEAMDMTEKLFQRLVFLVRDWENECWYSYGYHDDNEPQSLNYKKDMIDPNDNQCKEAQCTRKQILSYFNELKCFLLPHPGKNVSKIYFNGQTELIDNEFIDYLKVFVPLIVDRSNIVAKKIFSEFITGNSLKAYLTKWADIMDTEKFPEVKTLASAAADVNQKMAFDEAMSLYESKIKEYFDLKQTDQELCENHKSIEAESIDYFLNKPKGHISEDKKNELINFLSVRINQIFEVYRSNNLSRIDKEDAEQRLDNALETHRLLNDRLIEIQEQAEDIDLLGVSQKLFKKSNIKTLLLTLLKLCVFIIAIAIGFVEIKKINENQNLITDLTLLVKNLNVNQVPVGFIYTQLPGQQNASSIWNFGVWVEISPEYAGLFFRVLGDSSEPFGVLQNENTNKLTNLRSMIDNIIRSWEISVTPGVWSEWITTGAWQGKNVQTRFLVSPGEIRPKNKAIRLWKRIK